ncbi:putative 2-succinylbenzoate--CoA ligase [Mycolicibacterium chitae]|uniref:O-succinylbenzoic acid--CoA ligase MenE n=2 Tax=Mycobacteriaceae TaxID=1762 RepID=A0A448IB94_MYCCI|nr:o-succinylbenzoate--CoA ligase [Mycolicibacterium chitae]BBZ00856.1 putative 2-succinylbenzoate--CoA ligase [Mycolicibacterium chitae]VEG49703.1 O-succinylbenzoic acid--CoA ligase MenE [Mycolicibacterium chitae]
MMAALAAVLDGSATPVLPVPGGDLRQYELLTSSLRAGEDIDDDVALVIPTSGTTGTPKGALLTAPALIASATATHDRLGGAGTWLLALPPHHIAGMQVLIRSVVAGTTPVEIDVSSGFDVAALPEAVAAMKLGSGRRYASLVGVQLAKALADPAAAAALADLDAVLLGGGPASEAVLEGAAVAGISVVRSYGMSETAGGCVYDGRPLDGVQLRIDDDGRIVLGGATLAKGYRNPADPDPFAESGWFRTDDIGAVDDSGVLQVLGRADDAISTGGLTVLPQPVEAALITHPDVVDSAVFGVPDERLGQRVAAVVVLAFDSPEPTVAELRAHVEQTLDATAAPREIHIVEEVPRLGIGKVDRRALVDRYSPS